MRREQHAPEDAVDPRAPLHEQRETEARDVERRHEEDDIGDRDAKALKEKRIVQHPAVVGETDEAVSAETVHLEEAEAEREHHRRADEDEEAERIGQYEQIAGDPFPVLDGKRADSPLDRLRFERAAIPDREVMGRPGNVGAKWSRHL